MNQKNNKSRPTKTKYKSKDAVSPKNIVSLDNTTDNFSDNSVVADRYPDHLDEAFEKVCAQMLEVFLQKHKDYGKGNILSVKELGVSFRIAEKAERLKNLLMTQNEPTNESIEDSWIDIGVYAVIGILYRRGWFEKLEVRKKKD